MGVASSEAAVPASTGTLFTISKLSCPSENLVTRNVERSVRSVGATHILFAGPSPAVDVREGAGAFGLCGGRRTSVIVTGASDTVTVVDIFSVIVTVFGDSSLEDVERFVVFES